MNGNNYNAMAQPYSNVMPASVNPMAMPAANPMAMPAQYANMMHGPSSMPGSMPASMSGSMPASMSGSMPASMSGPFAPSGSVLASSAPGTPEITPPGQLPMEVSYIENILRLNLGKEAMIYMTYENNSEWNAKVYKGVLEAAGRDHIVISDPDTGKRYLLLMVNLDYITFDEELNYIPTY
ncbi:spore coat protein GerQ [Chengkuizengella sp. SCS-71B]|uniref:spore coat protein GerQ n=1 Tax=Chengkuizengella sp. SCS-71B TaxID=3115290 RepID=UPI0039B76BB0